MKISKVIKKLKEVKKELGDLDLIYYQAGWGFRKLQEYEFEKGYISIEEWKEDRDDFNVYCEGDEPTDFEYITVFCIGQTLSY